MHRRKSNESSLFHLSSVNFWKQLIKIPQSSAVRLEVITTFGKDSSIFTLNIKLIFRILSTIDRELLKPSASVALHKHSNALVDVLPPEADSSITMLSADEKVWSIFNIIANIPNSILLIFSEIHFIYRV